MTSSYSIQECAERTGLTASALRYYERKNLTPAITRDKNGHRCYNDRDIMWIEFVKCMRTTGMPLREIQVFGDLHFSGGNPHKRLAILHEHHARMLAQRETLDEAIDKIGKKIGIFSVNLPVREANHEQT